MRTATPTLARRDLLRAAGLRHLTEEKGHCLLQWMGNNIHAVCTAYISNCSPDLSALHRPTGMQLVQLKQVED
ncbi:hypothetical protein C2845_PM13G08510 [Panicum miliaceum]|uniref:Uncharacterized protein n=1 Tax=Panicum miliaceum TaxID=4540 RepID=A0A3L6RK95_PANMI|nr:hypothetical protein C2845_PM13G08510 [Panicum miliaceum]